MAQRAIRQMAVGKLFRITLVKKNALRYTQLIMVYFGAFIALYLLLIAVMYVGQRKLMYSPSQALGPPAVHGVAEAVPVKLTSTDGLTITSWFRAPGTNKPILIYFHGNAGHIGDRSAKVRPFLDAGYGLLLVGYRGFGGNPGQPTERGLYDDASAALEFLVRTGIAPDHWVLYGESLGTAVAVEMAARFGDVTPAAAVVLEAPFTAMADVAKSQYPFVPVNLLIKDRYDSISKIKRINSPLFILHGDQDRTVAQKLGKQIFETALEPKEAIWVEGAGHNNLYDFDADLRVIEFIKRIWMERTGY